jgi:hypothetical protein
MVTDLAFLGRRDLLAGIEDVHCKANWIAVRRRYVEDHYGTAGIDEVLRRLSDPAARRAFLEPPLPMAWTRVGPALAIDRAICEGPMGGSIARMRHFGAEIAKYDVPGFYRAFFRLATPAFVFSKLNMVWSMYFRKGSVRCEVGDGQAEVHLEGIVLPHYLSAYGITGWLDATLELLGARSPSVRYVHDPHAGAPHSVWLVRWLTRSAGGT